MVEKLRSKEKTTQRSRKYYHQERREHKENNCKDTETPASENLVQMAKTPEATQRPKGIPTSAVTGINEDEPTETGNKDTKKQTVLCEGLL